MTANRVYREHRTTNDPEGYVAAINGRVVGSTVYGGLATLRVTLVSVDGETASGRKRITIEIEEVQS